MINIKTFIFCLLFLFCYAELSAGQTNDADDVEAVIQTLFDGMLSADDTMMRKVLHADVTLETAQNTGELAETDMNRFLESVAGAEPGVLDEQISGLTIHIDGNLATVWMRYEFYNAGEFSHCGVNSMDLIKTAEGWKIFAIVDTRQRDGCEAG